MCGIQGFRLQTWFHFVLKPIFYGGLVQKVFLEAPQVILPVLKDCWNLPFPKLLHSSHEEQIHLPAASAMSLPARFTCICSRFPEMTGSKNQVVCSVGSVVEM